MKTYQEWRDIVEPLMSKLCVVTGVELHASYKRYADGRREVLREEQAEREELLNEIP
jgi:hypothetical protein